MNKSFIEGTHTQFAYDSTSLGLLKTCPRKYYYQMIEEWRPKHDSIHLLYGICFHSALELYDRIKFEGGDHEQALHACVSDTLRKSKDLPKVDDRKSRFGLIRSIVWYLDQFKDDPCITIKLKDGNPAVELSFRMELDLIAPNGRPYLLCGHLDRVVRFMDAYWIMDRKTTTSTLNAQYFARYSPDNQMSLYTFAGKIILQEKPKGVIVDAAQCAVGFNRYQRGFVNRTEGQLAEWLDDTQDTIQRAEEYSRKGYWPMNDTACDKYGGCPFRNVCAKDPSVRQNFLEADFMKQTWDPLTTREA